MDQNISSTNEQSGNNSSGNPSDNNSAFMEQLKLCIPSVSDFTSGVSAGLTTLMSLFKDTRGTVANSAAESAAWSTQIRTYLLPLTLVMGFAAFVKGSFIGHTLPFLGSWTEPIVAGFIFHAMTAIISVIAISVLPLFLIKVLTLTDGHSNVLSLLKTTSTPSLIASWFVVLGGLGTFIGIAGGLFGLYCLWQGSAVMSERNSNTSALKFFAFTILGGILIGVVSMVLLSPLVPTDFSNFPRP